MRTHFGEREFAKSMIDEAIRKTLSAYGRKPRQAFANLLWKIQLQSELLKPRRYVGGVDSRRLDLILSGLSALFEHRKGWLRPVEEWEPKGSTLLPIFSSLAHHLFASYPVPPVLLGAWFCGLNWYGRRRQRWFCHAGAGGSLRTAGFPLPLSKRMAHEFAQAPAYFSIEFAVRWAQVRGLGGSDELAHAIASTRLGTEFQNDEFWTSVIHLLLNTPRLDLAQIGPIVEYLNDQKFEAERVIIGDDNEIALEPPQPNLCIKGRTVASLMRSVSEWQPPTAQRRVLRWGRSGFGEYRQDDGGELAWTIRELLDSEELVAEGKAMHHCVADYTLVCSKRDSTIWSLGSESPEGRQRFVTIEVDPKARRVVQANSKCNEDPDERCMAILKEWASQEGLAVEPPEATEP